MCLPPFSDRGPTGLDSSRGYLLFLTRGHVLTFRGATDVSRGTGVGRALGVLGKSILPRPVKVVSQILGVPADLLILKVTGVVCLEGTGGGIKTLSLSPLV